MNIRQRYFGDKDFYRRIVTVMLPIMAQNAITNFVGLLDNIMVGRVGTLEMSGVSVINTLMLVYNCCVFGAVAGVGIYTAEYYGAGNEEGVRNSFRFKTVFAVALAVLAVSIFLIGGDGLISLYLEGKGDPADAAQILDYGKQYLRIIMIGLIPHAFTQSYADTLRNCRKVMPPMAAGLTAMAVKVVLNYLLIFGYLGFPRLGIVGAGISVVISRFVELGVIVSWTKRHLPDVPFMKGVFRTLKVPGRLCLEMIRSAFPLMVNETVWSAGLAFLTQCYTTRALNVVAAVSISNTLYNLFSVTFKSAGTAIGILIGQMLGVRAFAKAKEEVPKMIVFSTMIGLAVAVVYVGIAFTAPGLYNVTPEVRRIARDLLLATIVFIPVNGALSATYHTLKAGGNTFLVMLVDCGAIWLFQALPTFLLSRFTGIGIIPLYFFAQCGLILKLAVQLYFVRRGGWARSLVEEA
jgi:putative MATE family efflux protein